MVKHSTKFIDMSKMDIESLENLNDLTHIVKCDQEEKILGWALGLVQVLVSGVDFEIHMKFVGVI